MPSLSGKVSALPTEEVIAFPFGEGGGFADGRGLCGGKCSHSAGINKFSVKLGEMPSPRDVVVNRN